MEDMYLTLGVIAVGMFILVGQNGSELLVLDG